MKYALQLTNFEISPLRDIVQAAEELGYDAALLSDHLAVERAGGLRINSFDPIVAGAMLAEATRKIYIGQIVLCNLFRHPMIAAQSLMTLDRVSNGRLLAGIGTGYLPMDFKMSGIPRPKLPVRARMLDEAVTCIRSLWTNDKTTFTGEFYSLTDAMIHPKPVQKPHPPILMGGARNEVIRVAAKHADYLHITVGEGPENQTTEDRFPQAIADAWQAKLAFLREETKKAGREPDAVRVSNLIMKVEITDAPMSSGRTAGKMGAFHGLSTEMFRLSPLALVGTAEECINELRRRQKEWDISQFIFSSLDGIDPSFLRTLSEKVLKYV